MNDKQMDVCRVITRDASNSISAAKRDGIEFSDADFEEMGKWLAKDLKFDFRKK